MEIAVQMDTESMNALAWKIADELMFKATHEDARAIVGQLKAFFGSEAKKAQKLEPGEVAFKLNEPTRETYDDFVAYAEKAGVGVEGETTDAAASLSPLRAPSFDEMEKIGMNSKQLEAAELAYGLHPDEDAVELRHQLFLEECERLEKEAQAGTSFDDARSIMGRDVLEGRYYPVGYPTARPGTVLSLSKAEADAVRIAYEAFPDDVAQRYSFYMMKRHELEKLALALDEQKERYRKELDTAIESLARTARVAGVGIAELRDLVQDGLEDLEEALGEKKAVGDHSGDALPYYKSKNPFVSPGAGKCSITGTFELGPDEIERTRRFVKAAPTGLHYSVEGFVEGVSEEECAKLAADAGFVHDFAAHLEFQGRAFAAEAVSKMRAKEESSE